MSRKFIEEREKILKDAVEFMSDRVAQWIRDKYFQKLFEKSDSALDSQSLTEMEETFNCSKSFILQEIKTLKKNGFKSWQFNECSSFVYDLESVDMKYLAKIDQSKPICTYLTSMNARVFWLSSFPNSHSATIDEFMVAIQELCKISGLADPATAYPKDFDSLRQASSDYLISIEKGCPLLENLFSHPLFR